MFLDIIRGMKSYWSSFFLFKKLKLWKYFIIPIFISFFVGVLVLFMAWTFADDLGVFISELWPWETGKSTFSSIGTFFGGLSILLLGLVLYKHLVLAFASPFMSPVSEKIEKYYFEQEGCSDFLNKHRNSSFNEQLIRSLRINFRNLVREILFSVPLLLLSFIPIIGLFTSAILFFIQSYYAGFGNMDYTLERHYNYKKSVNFVKKNRGIAIGVGIMFMLTLLIPVVGFLIVLPFSVTSSSISTIKKIHENERKN